MAVAVLAVTEHEALEPPRETLSVWLMRFAGANVHRRLVGSSESTKKRLTDDEAGANHSRETQHALVGRI